MYELEIKFNGKPIANQKYIGFDDVLYSIKRLNYENMRMMLDTCIRVRHMLDNDYKVNVRWSDVITCNVTYYDDDDISTQYEFYRIEVRQ